MDFKYLNRINSPSDIKNLTYPELDKLAEEIRSLIVSTVMENGGHLASNLGAVELTIAMHKVFDSPKDQFVWDVGHQVYTHKLLTGRYSQFSSIRKNGGLSGFPNPMESEHDVFAAGHSGTSISSAYGLSVAKTMSGDSSYTIAVIGDGSCTGGLVYEALNNAGDNNTHLIVVLNDNEMSISSPVGALARYLTVIRTNPTYFRFKDNVKDVLDVLPCGDAIISFVSKKKKLLKNRLYQSNFFEDLGFEYMGPLDGHDIKELTLALTAAREVDKPVLIHINTVKGKGYAPAEENPAEYHGVSAGCKSSGKCYSSVFGDELVSLASANNDICAITAAMSLGTGLYKFSKRFPDRFFDVGIAEEHAVTFAGGLAAGGKIPVFAVYSTFLQRAYDEIVHDVAMQNKKVILGVDRAGFVGEDGRSHNGLLDIAFLRSIPTASIYCPASYAELSDYLKLAVSSLDGVIAIRYPRGGEGYLPADYAVSSASYSIFGSNDAPVTIVTFGDLFSEAIKVYEEMPEKVRVIKLGRIWPIDEEAVNAAMSSSTVLFYEEGIKSGGVGEAFGTMLLSKKYNGEYKHIAVDNTFVHHASVAELKDEFGMSAEKMKEEVIRRV